MQRFFISEPFSIDMILTDEAIVHQITHVLRSKIGEHIILFFGDGSEVTYEITQIEKRQIFLRGLEQTFPKEREPSPYLTLYQAIPNKQEKVEWILQKAVEVGIAHIYFFRSRYSQKLVLSETKQRRYKTIIREALEQCGGLFLPTFTWSENGVEKVYFAQPTPEEAALNSIKTHIVLDPQGALQGFDSIPTSQNIGLWVGPEGGWAPEEGEIMERYGFITARFSQRILRTETAGIVTAFGIFHKKSHI